MARKRSPAGNRWPRAASGKSSSRASSSSITIPPIAGRHRTISCGCRKRASCASTRLTSARTRPSLCSSSRTFLQGSGVNTQAEKARACRALHERAGVFIMPNPWDAGTAKLFASLGFEALATTSLGVAASLGRVDGRLSVSRDELIENCRQIAAATDLPVNADLENGYADDPEEAASILRLAAQAGIVGGSLEDTTGDDAKPVYDFDFAVKRVAAGVRVARSLPFPFTFTARADGLLHKGG